MPGMIATEWIEQHGGAEKVLDGFIEAFPDSSVLCSWNDDIERFPDEIRVRESPLAATPLRGRKALSVPLLPLMWRWQKLTEPDWVLVSSHLFAHHVSTRPHTPKLVYVHSPARYLWVPSVDRRARFAKPILPLLRSIDRRRSWDASSIAANSNFVAERVADCWDCEPPRVIYPPVDVDSARRYRSGDQLTAAEHAQLDALPDTFVLGASRLVPYKALDDVLRVGKVVDLPVVIAGSGPERERLEQLATELGVHAVFLGGVSNSMLYALYQRAYCYIFPPVEDFGIMPVEAMAVGAPVLVNRVGGAAESVLDGITGFHCDFSDSSDITNVLDSIGSLRPEDAEIRAQQFSKARFVAEIRSWVEEMTSVRAAA